MHDLQKDRLIRRTSLNWFVNLTIAGGMIAYASETFFNASIPTEAISRSCFVLQTLLIVGFSVRQNELGVDFDNLDFQDHRLRSASTLLKYSAIAVILTSIFPLISAIMSGNAPVSPIRPYYFMYGMGLVAAIVCLVNFNISGGTVFRLITIICILFGAFQIYLQDLFLPTQLKITYGLQYEFFAGGNIRAVSFFNSAPRLAEFLSFVILYLLASAMISKRRTVLIMALTIFILWILFNTYSRSGYILLASAAIALVAIYSLHAKILTKPYHYVGFIFIATASIQFLIYLAQDINFFSYNVFDSTSLSARIDHWSQTIRSIQDYGIADILLGSGTAALFSRSELEYFVVDNMFISVFLYSGAFGLISILVFYGMVLRFGVIKFGISNSPALLSLLALSLGMLVEGLFLDNHNAFFIVCTAIIALRAYKQTAEIVAVPKRFSTVPEEGIQFPHNPGA